MELGVSYPTHFPAFRDRPIMPLRRLPSVSLSLSLQAVCMFWTVKSQRIKIGAKLRELPLMFHETPVHNLHRIHSPFANRQKVLSPSNNNAAAAARGRLNASPPPRNLSSFDTANAAIGI